MGSGNLFLKNKETWGENVFDLYLFTLRPFKPVFACCKCLVLNPEVCWGWNSEAPITGVLWKTNNITSQKSAFLCIFICFLILTFIHSLIFWNKVSPQNHHVAQDVLELLILWPLPPHHWDYSCALLYLVWKMKPRLCVCWVSMSANGVTSPTHARQFKKFFFAYHLVLTDGMWEKNWFFF